jgi:DNA-binding XRE family transcriptional regulator
MNFIQILTVTKVHKVYSMCWTPHINSLTPKISQIIVNPKSFGEWLRNERKKRGLTVEVVAKDCEVSRSYITLIENGKRLPGKKVIPKIAEALDLEVVVVLNWYLEDVGRRIKEELEIL